MKFMTGLPKGSLVFITLAVCGWCFAAAAAEGSALGLIKEANEYVGKDVRDQVVQIRSEKSVASLTPNIWYVVFYDKDATFKTAEVKFAAGKKQDVKHPMRQPFAYM